MGLTTVQRYCAACDTFLFLSIVLVCRCASWGAWLSYCLYATGCHMQLIENVALGLLQHVRTNYLLILVILDEEVLKVEFSKHSQLE